MVEQGQEKINKIGGEPQRFQSNTQLYIIYINLGTLVAFPWLDHCNNDDYSNDKKDENGNARPFPGAPL